MVSIAAASFTWRPSREIMPVSAGRAGLAAGLVDRGGGPMAIIVQRGQAVFLDEVFDGQVRIERGQSEPVVLMMPDDLDFRPILLLHLPDLLCMKVDLEKPPAEGQRGPRPLLVLAGRRDNVAADVVDAGRTGLWRGDDETLVHQCQRRELARGGKRRWEENNLGAFLLQALPTVPPIDVKAYLNADPAEIGFENRSVILAWCGSGGELILGGMNLVKHANRFTVAPNQHC